MTDKDRHNAHISEREKDEAAEHLNAALKAVCAAMTILDMKER